jgi:ribonuclease BN (tRNA processing enzyme)
MKIRLLGAHKIESKDTRCACLLIDDILAIDAGALTSRLSLKAQLKLKALLLSHRHYDHIKDIPALGMNFFLLEKTLEICTIQSVYEDVSRYLLDGVLYPDFRQEPPGKPAFKFNIVEPGREVTLVGYKILPVTVKHSVPGVGYQVTSPAGKKLFYTSDTGPGLAECWRQVSPDLLIIEVSAKNKYHDLSLEAGHLTPSLLQTELESFRKLKGYLPQIVTIHADPLDEKGIETELAGVAKALNTEIQLGREGMRIEL